MFGFDLTKTISQCRNINVAVEISSDDYDKEDINECHHNESTEDNFADAYGKPKSRKKAKKKLLQIPVKTDCVSIWMCNTCCKRFGKKEEALDCGCSGSGGSIIVLGGPADNGSGGAFSMTAGIRGGLPLNPGSYAFGLGGKGSLKSVSSDAGIDGATCIIAGSSSRSSEGATNLASGSFKTGTGGAGAES